MKKTFTKNYEYLGETWKEYCVSETDFFTKSNKNKVDENLLNLPNTKISNYCDVMTRSNKILYSMMNDDVMEFLNVNDNKWNHVVISGDSNGISKIYINKELEFITNPGTPNSNNENLLIGNFQGSLEDLMIFNEGLSDLEAKGLYENQK